MPHGTRKTINTKVVIAELHRAFKMFNDNLFNGSLPEPAILIQSRGNKKLTLGWCSVQKIWKNEVTSEEKYEINIVAEALNRGTYPVMATLLHEMIHLHNLVNNIKDTSRGNTYHNMKFKKTAEAHGLLIEHADRIGWSVSKLQGTTMNLIDEHKFDEAVFSLGRRDLNFEGAGKPRKKVKTSSRKYICPSCGTSIRASKDVNILCADCTNFEEGKIVQMYKEETEEDVEENIVQYVCLDCGCVSELPEGQTLCPECGGELQELPIEEEPTEEPIIEPVQEPSIVEEPTQLDDGAGNMVDVLQGKFDMQKKKIKWTVERLAQELINIADEFELKGIQKVFPSGTPVEISEHMISQWASYKEGKKFVFSKMYLESMNDDEIIDTIKHQYIHHYEYMVKGRKVNHKREFKDLCVELGVDPITPTKNHRAVK